MIRVVIENVLLFLLPAAAYVAYMLLMRSGNTSAGAVINDSGIRGFLSVRLFSRSVGAVL